jgi:hypothetical protein
MFCLRCGYSLHLLPEPRCPECGRAFDPKRASTYAISGANYRIRRVVRLSFGAAVVALVCVAVYASSYYTMVRLEGPGVTTGAPPWGRHAEYPFDSEIGRRFYGPMESFDEWLRPRAWQWWGFAEECVPAYEYVTSQQWPEELEPDADALISAIHDTWFGLDSDIDAAREALRSGEGTQAELDAAIAKRNELVTRALKAEKQFRARVAAVRPGH